MRSILLGLILAIITTLLLPSGVFAEDSDLPKISTLSKESVHDGDYFAAGEIVEIYGTVNGDVYVAGGEILVDGNINGDILAAGGIVNISGNISQDVRVVGGQVDVSANIGRNLSVVAGEMTIDEDTVLTGNLVFASGNATINAPLSNDVTAASGNVTFHAPIGGDVTAAVEELRFTNDSEVSGNLTYWSNTEATGTDQVKGEVKMNKIETPEDYEMDDNLQKGIAWGSGIFVFLSNMLVGIVLVKLLPDFTRNTSEVIRNKSLMSFLFGFAALFLIPIFVIILFISVVGIPLGLISLFLYFLFLYIAKFFVVLLMGRIIFKRFKIDKSDPWALVVGVLIYAIIGLFSVIGFWAKFLTMVVGFGAVTLNLKTLTQKVSG